MHVDVDAWALDCREKLATIYRKRGEIAAGAFILATLDPTTGEEFPTPQTWTQLFSDYDSVGAFEDALRVQCLRTRALASVVFSVATRYALGHAVCHVLLLSYERRGRTRATKWTARIGPEHTLEEFVDTSIIPSPNLTNAVFPPVN